MKTKTPNIILEFCGKREFRAFIFHICTPIGCDAIDLRMIRGSRIAEKNFHELSMYTKRYEITSYQNWEIQAKTFRMIFMNTNGLFCQPQFMQSISDEYSGAVIKYWCLSSNH